MCHHCDVEMSTKFTKCSYIRNQKEKKIIIYTYICIVLRRLKGSIYFFLFHRIECSKSFLCFELNCTGRERYVYLESLLSCFFHSSKTVQTLLLFRQQRMLKFLLSFRLNWYWIFGCILVVSVTSVDTMRLKSKPHSSSETLCFIKKTALTNVCESHSCLWQHIVFWSSALIEVVSLEKSMSI